MQPQLKTQIVHTGTMTHEIGKWILRVMELRQDRPLGQLMVEQIRNFVDCKTDHIMFTHPMYGECHIRRVDGFPDCYVVMCAGQNHRMLGGLSESLQDLVDDVMHLDDQKPAAPAPGLKYVHRLDSKPSWVRPGLTMLPGKWYAIGDDKIIHLADVVEGWNLTLPLRMSLFATESDVLDRESGRNTLISSTLNQIDAERYLAAIERLEQRHADSTA